MTEGPKTEVEESMATMMKTKPSVRRLLALATAIALVSGGAAASAAEKKKPSAKKKKDAATDTATVQKLTAGGPTLKYEQFRKQVELKVAEKREEQIKGLDRLLELGTKEREVPDIKFRLAELYYEKSRFYFFRAQEADDKAAQTGGGGEKAELDSDKKRMTQESKAWIRRATDIYKELRDKYPKYERMPEVLFALGQSYWSEGQFEAAIEVYAELIRNFKDSPLVPEAWIAFGEFYFNEGGLQKALRSYEKAAEDKRSRVYGFALYKQGWCYYNLGDWKKARSKFKATVYYSQLADQMSGENRLALGKEAQKDFVRTYAHDGEASRAKFEFADLIGKENCNEAACMTLLEMLGSLWYDDGYFDESAYIYAQLIKLGPGSTRNPYFQGRIVDLVSRGGDKQKVITEVRRLVEVYEATKDSVAKMTGEPKVVDKAKEDVKEAAVQAESQIRKLAQIWNQEAKKTRQPKTYEFAKTMYTDYLKLFPSSKYAYELRFQLGDLYYKLEMFDEAAQAYEATVKADPKGQYLVEAANDNVLAIEEHVKDLKIPRPKPAEKPQDIHKAKIRLIEACDRYAQFVPKEKADKLVAVKFKAAKIYYDYSHFDEALKRFDEIATNQPADKEAEYAANLVIDVYNIRKDWRSLYDYSTRYLKSEELIKEREKLHKDLMHFSEYAKFKLVQILEENVNKEHGDVKLVAQAYQDFYQEFPKSENADKALFNASVAWDKIGERKQAQKLRQKLIKEFPGSPLGADVSYYIAKSNEERTRYKRAAELLAAFAKKYPEDKRARDALYNASIFYSGIGDVKEGTRLREDYLNKYGKAKGGEQEAAEIYYSIARDLERAGKWQEAVKRYAEFVKSFPSSPKVWDALHSQSLIMREKLKQNGQADKIDGTILATFEGAKKKGTEVPAAGASYASLVAFNKIEKDYQDYKRLKIKTPNLRDPKPFQKSLEEKVKNREKVIKEYTAIVARFQQADSTIASLFRIAESWDDFVNGIVNVPCPRGLTEEVCGLIKQELEQKAGPAREAALAAYKTCVAKSNELNTFTPYSTRCVKALEVLAPEAFPSIIERRVDYVQPERVQNLHSNPLILRHNGVPQGSPLDAPGKLARGKEEE